MATAVSRNQNSFIDRAGRWIGSAARTALSGFTNRANETSGRARSGAWNLAGKAGQAFGNAARTVWSGLGRANNAVKTFIKSPAGKVFGVAVAAYETGSSASNAADSSQGFGERLLSGLETAGYGIATAGFGWAAAGLVATAATAGSSSPVTLPATALAATTGAVA